MLKKIDISSSIAAFLKEVENIKPGTDFIDSTKKMAESINSYTEDSYGIRLLGLEILHSHSLFLNLFDKNQISKTLVYY
jgi:hypothetical protein